MSSEVERTGRGGDPWVDRLSEYLDGELHGRAREALEAHLRSCGTCAAALADLRAVVARAQALVDSPPAEDLWPGIEARIGPGAAPHASEARVRPVVMRDPRAWWARRFDLGMPQLAAAAVLLVALSAGAVWLAMRGATPPAAPSGGGMATRDAGGRPDGTVPTGLTSGAPAATTARAGDAAEAPALATLSNPRYDAAVAELEQALAEGRELDPRTLRVVEENLRIIDRALDDARRAVAADPGNTWLRSHLAATMKRKVDLLRSATLVASAQG